MRNQNLRGVSRTRVAGSAMAVAALLAGTVVLTVGTPAHAAADCSVQYTVNDWGGGFTTAIVVTNLGGPMTAWSLEWDFAGDQRVTNAWNGAATQSGSHVTLRSAAWNGGLPAGGSAQIGFQGTYSGSNAEPARFELNGVGCNGAATTPTPSPSRTTGVPILPVANPYRGVNGYVNPEWKAKAAAAPGGERISGTPTAVWLDSIAAINGNRGTGEQARMGLRDHLDAALAQGARYAQFVIYNLPGRDCEGRLTTGELDSTELQRYQRDFIDQIAEIQADPKYRDLRIINIIEPGTLQYLLTSVSSASSCRVAAARNYYQAGVGYALGAFAAVSNVYNYLDVSHHGRLGWTENFEATAHTLRDLVRSTPAGMASVHGFIVNTANYAATVEPYFAVTDNVGGSSVRPATWVDWNNYVDEQSFAQAMRNQLISRGFPADIGMLIDTSRNGWGGPNRPNGTSTSTDLNTYVDESRIDRRIHAGNWCNQSGAGLGERPTVDPAIGIDAYVWAKPPGESDGPHIIDPKNDDFRAYRMCDPAYTGSADNGNNLSGALPHAPARGEWFPTQFQQLMANANPAL